MPLKVSAPFHCSLMQLAADNLNKELKKYSFSSFKYPVISNLEAKPYTSKENIIDTLTMQVVKPVRWIESMQYIQNIGIDCAIEMGPKNVLKNLMKKNVQKIKVYSFENLNDIEAAKSELSKLEGIQPKENNLMMLIIRCLAIAVCTKNNNWNSDEYEKGVVETYRQVKQMQMKLEEEGLQPSIEQAEKALNMLKSVFETKKTSNDLRINRFNQLFLETGARHLFPKFEFV